MKTLTSNWKELRNTSGIYKFTFPSNKVYIGQSVDLYSRINSHIWTSKQPIKSMIKLYNAIKYYGLDNIQLEILWSIEKPVDTSVISKKLDDLEIEYINFYDSLKNGYNSTLGGKGATGYEVLPDQKEATKVRSTKATRQEKIDMIYEYGLDETARLLKVDVEVLEDSIIGSKDYSTTLRSTEKRCNTALTKSKENPLVMELVAKNYQYLKDRCIKKDIDEDYFNDVLLKMTYKYNVEDNFNAAFIHQFNILKMEYTLDKKVLDVSLKEIDEYPEDEFYYEDEPVEKIFKKNEYFSDEFINSLKAKYKN